MKILVIGSGGREHALVWKIAQNDRVSELYCAPGNPGTAQQSENVDLSPKDFRAIADFVKKNDIDLTVGGPEDPIVSGIVDYFNDLVLKIFGPTQKAARLEGSKVFAKKLMSQYSIPTADYQEFNDPEQARHFLLNEGRYPLVLKASGLAAGKGVLICQDISEAENGIRLMMEERAFGNAGEYVIIEEFLEGEEVSIFAISDGTDYILLSPAQDHKKVYDGDKGKNTGGMGAYAPAPIATTSLINTIRREIVEPTFGAMQKEKSPYHGLLYFGIIVTENGPKVLEYNCRFGDPEAQIILPLLRSDLVSILLASIDGTIKDQFVQFESGYALDIVLTSGGYPDQYQKGKTIHGLDQLDDDILIFQAGTKKQDNQLVTNGGRVLYIVGKGEEFFSLRDHLYRNIEKIKFDDMHYRKDIGFRAASYIKNKS